MKELSENTIIHFITGQCSEDDLRQINEWTAKDKRHTQHLFQLERIYQHLQCRFMPQCQVEEALNRVHENWGESTMYVSRFAFLGKWRRYAAAIVLIVLTGVVLFWYGKGMLTDAGQEYIVAQTNATTTKQMLLPDGSKVWLNHHSSLSYPEHFNAGVRKVLLTGEGYFEVAKDSTRPFVVENDAMSVTVLGTVFDFKNDAANMRSEVCLLEGSVEVRNRLSAGQMVLLPGQKALLDYHTGHMTVSRIDDGIDVVWHTNLIPFTNASISEIVSKLEKIYGVRIEIGSNVDLRRTYSGGVRYKENIDSVLHLLQNTLPINFQKTSESTYFVEKVH